MINQKKPIQLLLTGTRGYLGKRLLYSLKKNSNISITEGDIINRNKCINLNDSFDPFKFDLICHLGASSKKNNKTNDITKKNIEITKKIFLNAKKNAKLKVIFISANSIVGKTTKKPIKMSTKSSPQDEYSLSKLVGEKLLKKYIKEKNRVIIRLPAVYGENDNKQGFLRRIILSSKRNQNIYINNPNSLFNNAILLETVLEFLSKIILNNKKFMGKNFMLGAINEMAIIDIVNFINTSLNSKSKIIISKNKKLRENYLIDTEHSMKFGFKPNKMKTIIKNII